MTTPAVTFDYAAWIALFPEFALVLEPQATLYFNLAGDYFANDVCNPAYPAGRMPDLLNLVTAHLAWLFAARNAQGLPDSAGTGTGPEIVGRISTASEGSVSVSAELQSSGSPSEAFFTQTKYGFAFWQATAQYRTFRYAAQPTLVVNGAYPYVGRRGFGPVY